MEKKILDPPWGSETPQERISVKLGTTMSWVRLRHAGGLDEHVT